MQIADQSRTLELVKAFKDDKPTFVAGSSWQPDEEIFIPYFEKHKDWKLIIAPHVIGEDHLQQIEALLEGRKVERYTDMIAMQTRGNHPLDEELVERLKNAEVLIINCFGLLSSIYKYGDVAYVGGGFGVGIHNVLEAAVLNMPVVFGPNHEKIQEAKELIAAGGGYPINGADDFAKVMERFIADKASLNESSQKAGEYVKSASGATDKVLDAVNL